MTRFELEKNPFNMQKISKYQLELKANCALVLILKSTSNQMLNILAQLRRSVEGVRGPISPRLSGLLTQLGRNVTAVASRWQHCVQFDRPGNRYKFPEPSR